MLGMSQGKYRYHAGMMEASIAGYVTGYVSVPCWNNGGIHCWVCHRVGIGTMLNGGIHCWVCHRVGISTMLE